MTDKDILISDLNDISEILNNNGYGGWCETIRKAVAMLNEQEAKEQLSDAVHETAKQFRQTIVRCKDCDNKECWGRAGDVVCGIDGTPHRPDWFCADGERREGDG